MGNAGWLVRVLPAWFASLFHAAFAPDDGFKVLGILAVSGVLAFVVGAVIAVLRSNRRPFAILASILLSFIVVAIAGAMRGKVHGELLSVILWSVTILQCAIGVAVVYWARGVRLAAAMMVPLCASFWLFSELVAAMSFQDVWL
jgi:hypothetical protein